MRRIRPRLVLPAAVLIVVVVTVVVASPSMPPPPSAHSIPPPHCAKATNDRRCDVVLDDGENDDLLDDDDDDDQRIVIAVGTTTRTTSTTPGGDGDRHCTSSSLPLARNLRVPPAIGTQDAEFEHHEFWKEHGRLLRDAWTEWEEEGGGDGGGGKMTARTTTTTTTTTTARCPSKRHATDEDGPPGTCRTGRADEDDILADELSIAIEDAHVYPSEEIESRLRSLWNITNVGGGDGGGPHHLDDDDRMPRGVYAVQLLSEYGIRRIRSLLDAASASGIPMRRPNGMNRHGVVLDRNVDGAISTRSLASLVEDVIVRRIARPVGRMMYPDRICRGGNDDLEHFAFTVRYDGGVEGGGDVGNGREYDAHHRIDDDGRRDVELKEHRDASVVTLNINLNLPDEEYDGSEVYFRGYPSNDDDIGGVHRTDDDDDDGGVVRFAPGMAIMHLGAHRHGAMPISSSSGGGNGSRAKRYNLVIWLFGKDGDVRISPCEEGRGRKRRSRA